MTLIRGPTFRDSVHAPYRGRIKPQRGAVNTSNIHSMPVEISGSGFHGVVQLKIGGLPVSGSEINVSGDNLVRSYVPATLANGNHRIELNVDGKLANRREFEVVPLIQSVIPAQCKAGDAVKINGQRLKGTSVSIRISAAVIDAGANSNLTQVSFNSPKSLAIGTYEIRVIVDGHESNAATLKIKA